MRFLTISVLFPEFATNSVGIRLNGKTAMGCLWPFENKRCRHNYTYTRANSLLFDPICSHLSLLFILFIYLLDKKIRGGPPEEDGMDEYPKSICGNDGGTWIIQW